MKIRLVSIVVLIVLSAVGMSPEEMKAAFCRVMQESSYGPKKEPEMSQFLEVLMKHGINPTESKLEEDQEAVFATKLMGFGWKSIAYQNGLYFIFSLERGHDELAGIRIYFGQTFQEATTIVDLNKSSFEVLDEAQQRAHALLLRAQQMRNTLEQKSIEIKERAEKNIIETEQRRQEAIKRKLIEQCKTQSCEEKEK